jgi:hypothetical protein
MSENTSPRALKVKDCPAFVRPESRSTGRTPHTTCKISIEKEKEGVPMVTGRCYSLKCPTAASIYVLWVHLYVRIEPRSSSDALSQRNNKMCIHIKSKQPQCMCPSNKSPHRFIFNEGGHTGRRCAGMSSSNLYLL